MTISTNSEFVLSGNIKLAFNEAYFRGGAIDFVNSKLWARATVTFSNNLANNAGGGVSSSGSVLVFRKNFVFLNNSAHHKGGGLYLINKSRIIIIISSGISV